MEGGGVIHCCKVFKSHFQHVFDQIKYSIVYAIHGYASIKCAKMHLVVFIYYQCRMYDMGVCVLSMARKSHQDRYLLHAFIALRKFPLDRAEFSDYAPLEKSMKSSKQTILSQTKNI